MEQVVGLDVSVQETHICVVDGSGAVLARAREAKQPGLLAAALGKLAPAARVVVLGPAWVARRMKALRFALIALPGRRIRRARRLIIRLSSEQAGLDLLLAARRTIVALARGPT